MTGVKQFEDLIAWQKARELTRHVYLLSSQGQFAKDYALTDQTRRATISIMSNIAEGFDRNSPNDFHRFLVIAKASCAEVRSQLYIALDVGYLDENSFQETMHLTKEVGRLVSGLRVSVERRRSS